MTLGVLLNIGVGLIIAIAAIVGLCVGFCRQFSKPLVGIVAILGAIILVAIIYPLIFQTGIFNGFVAKASSWFSDEFYKRPVTDIESFRAAIADNYLRIFSGSDEWVFAQMTNVLTGTDLEWTIGNFFGRAFVNVTIEFAMWIIFYLIIKYFLYGVKYLLCKITQVIVFKSIDRILGIAWSLVWAYLIVIGIMLTVGEIVVVQFFPGAESTIAEWIRDASLLKLAHDTNVLGSFIANIMGMRLIAVA